MQHSLGRHHLVHRHSCCPSWVGIKVLQPLCLWPLFEPGSLRALLSPLLQGEVLNVEKVGPKVLSQAPP